MGHTCLSTATVQGTHLTNFGCRDLIRMANPYDFRLVPRSPNDLHGDRETVMEPYCNSQGGNSQDIDGNSQGNANLSEIYWSSH